MIILGINAFHGDSAACLVRDGVLVAAAEEERFRRIKHWAGFPTLAIAYCLEEAGLTISDVDHVAVNQDSSANFRGKLSYLLSARPDLGMVVDRLRNRKARAGVRELIAANWPGKTTRFQTHQVEHHVAHLFSAFYVSPFEDATTVSVDGFGDFASAAWGRGQGNDLEVERRVFFPHSLGVFYQALTQYLGFPHYGDEYKVMGLAPYGEPRFLGEMRNIVALEGDGSFRLDLKYFKHHRERTSFAWSEGAPEFGDLFSNELEEMLGPKRSSLDELTQRHKDIARSVQAMYEEAFFNLLNVLWEKHHTPNITLAGGCAANSVANGKIRRKTPYERVYVQAAAGDAGGAIGAAFSVWRKIGGSRSFVMDHAYWGPQYQSVAIDNLLTLQADRLSDEGCKVEHFDDFDVVCARTASAIADGKVVGWFDGRMEWGPRALGNRSIVCDPRRSDMKDILNAKIKRRESFRPFAPSVLDEYVGEWFEENDAVPFMMQVFQIREEKRVHIPAVTHIDGSGRLQTVKREANWRYHSLISAFHDLTGVPMVLNTSFNENEPVVCRPDEALECFLRTKMDVLVLSDVVITRGIT